MQNADRRLIFIIHKEFLEIDKEIIQEKMGKGQ